MFLVHIYKPTSSSSFSSPLLFIIIIICVYACMYGVCVCLSMCIGRSRFGGQRTGFAGKHFDP